jgi:hypothetical protein
MGALRKNPPKNAVSETERLAAQGYSIIGIAKHFGVGRETFKRWCEEDEALQEAFAVGRETERQALHSLLVQSAVAGKNANVNAIFLLKARHGYREFDSPNTKVDVSVAVSSVLVVKDHGTDEQWAARVAEQQRKLALEHFAPLQLEAPQSPLQISNDPRLGNEAAVPVPARPEPLCVAPSWKPGT